MYVGSAEDQSHDQELDAVLLPADTPGRFKFVLEVPAPDPTLIPPADILGVTIVLLTCSYKSAEFIRVGYYVNNDHPDYAPAPEPQAEDADVDVDADADADNDGDDVDVDDVGLSKPQPSAKPQLLQPTPATMPDVNRITRTIAASEPRVTKFPHKFDFDHPPASGVLELEPSGDGSSFSRVPNELSGELRTANPI